MAYDHFPDAESFTVQVTTDLHTVYADRHLRLFEQTKPLVPSATSKRRMLVWKRFVQ